MNQDVPGMAASPDGRRIAWGLAAAAVLANAAGYALDLYSGFGWFDRVLHFATTLALTYWLAVFVLRRVLADDGQHRLLLALVITCVGVAAGAWWELLEWGYDQLAPGDAIKGKHDTMLDLVMDTGGALLASWMSLRVLHPARGSEGGV